MDWERSLGALYLQLLPVLLQVCLNFLQLIPVGYLSDVLAVMILVVQV